MSLETGGLKGEANLRANRRLSCPAGTTIAVVRQVIEDGTDDDFVQKWVDTGLWGTPLYFADALDRWPHLHGQALKSIARADRPILMHCGRGHDRTGIMTVILLALAGATVDGIT